MPIAEQRLRVLYVSRIAAGMPFGVINDIVAAARVANPAQGITGALLFDGEHFCQLIEGPAAAAITLRDRIFADSRHVAADELLRAPIGAEGTQRSWRSGYCEAEQLDVFVGPQALRGDAALAVFLSVLGGADVE